MVRRVVVLIMGFWVKLIKVMFGLVEVNVVLFRRFFVFVVNGMSKIRMFEWWRIFVSLVLLL